MEKTQQLTTGKVLDSTLENIYKLNIVDLRLTAILKRPLLTNSDMATLFSIGVRSIPRWRKKYNIPFIKISGRVYFENEDVKEFMKRKYITQKK